MGTSTLSRFQRGALGQLVSEGHKTRQEMADAFGVAKSTIGYELARVKPYDSELAQRDADRKRRCGRHSILTASFHRTGVSNQNLFLPSIFTMGTGFQ